VITRKLSQTEVANIDFGFGEENIRFFYDRLVDPFFVRVISRHDDNDGSFVALLGNYRRSKSLSLPYRPLGLAWGEYWQYRTYSPNLRPDQAPQMLNIFAYPDINSRMLDDFNEIDNLGRVFEVASTEWEMRNKVRKTLDVPLPHLFFEAGIGADARVVFYSDYAHSETVFEQAILVASPSGNRKMTTWSANTATLILASQTEARSPTIHTSYTASYEQMPQLMGVRLKLMHDLPKIMAGHLGLDIFSSGYVPYDPDTAFGVEL
jgi:hypothetical protein